MSADFRQISDQLISRQQAAGHVRLQYGAGRRAGLGIKLQPPVSALSPMNGCPED
ncbi:hypothetical protein ACLBWT_01125 [Paenibacillus sp. D51F]